ncbi:MAG: YkvA family protein [Methylococcus sp.]|nr:YkvA family protein [Methylococcus sp.]
MILTEKTVQDSMAFAKARSRANEYASDPGKLSALLDKASKKAETKKGPLSEVRESLMACLRLLRACAQRQYTLPWQSLSLIVAAILYFVMPVDLIPDFILSLGFADDAALLAWTFRQVRSDLDEFRQWEAGQEGGDAPAVSDVAEAS